MNLIVFPFVAVRGYARVKSRDLAAWRERNPAFHRQLVLERLAFYPLLGLLFCLRPADTLLFLGLPYLAGQWGIIAINLVQHDGCDPLRATVERQAVPGSRQLGCGVRRL